MNNDLTNYQDFPIDVLPNTIRDFVVEVSAAQGCKPELVLLPLFSCLANAIGSTRRISPRSDWDAPSVIWTATIGDSGCGKTPTFNAATKFVKNLETKAYKKYEEEMADYKALTAKKPKKLKGSSETKPAVIPEPPKQRRHYVDDVTTEAIVVVLAANPRGVMVINSELKSWFASFDRYISGKGGGDVSKWLGIWDADPIFVDRKSAEISHIRVPRPIVSVAGTIQPSVLSSIGSQNIENGLVARMLLAYPPQSPSTWSSVGPEISTYLAVEDVISKLFALENTETDEGEEPVCLKLSSEAMKCWGKFYNKNNVESKATEAPLKYAVAKYGQYVLRFAMIYHLIENVDSPSANIVSGESMEKAVQTVDWFHNEASRIYGIFGSPVKKDDTKNLIYKIAMRGGRITIRDLQNSNSKKYKTTACAEAELQSLVAKKIGKFEDDGKTFVLTQ